MTDDTGLDYKEGFDWNPSKVCEDAFRRYHKLFFTYWVEQGSTILTEKAAIPLTKYFQ